MLKMKRTELEQSIQGFKWLLKRLHAKFKRQTIIIGELKHDIKTSNETILEDCQTVIGQQNRITNLEHEKESLVVAHTGRQIIVTDQKAELKHLRQRLSDTIDSNRKLEKQNPDASILLSKDILIKSLQKEKTGLQEANEGAGRFNDNLKADNKKLDTINATLRAERNGFYESNFELKKLNNNQAISINRCAQHVAQLKVTIKKLKSQVETTEISLIRAVKVIEKRKETNEAIDEMLTDLQADKIKGLEKDLADRWEEIKKLRQHRHNRDQAFRERAGEHGELESQIEKLELLLNDCRQSQDNQSDTIGGLQEENEELKIKNSCLQPLRDGVYKLRQEVVQIIKRDDRLLEKDGE